VSVRQWCLVATVMGDIQPAARRIYRQAGFRQDSSARFLHTRTHTHTQCFSLYTPIFKNSLELVSLPYSNSQRKSRGERRCREKKQNKVQY